MSISSLPVRTGRPLSNVVAVLSATFVQWRQAREQRIAEQQAIALLQSVEPEVLADIGATTNSETRAYPQADRSGRTEVGPLLAVYLPYSGRSGINDARERAARGEARAGYSGNE